MSAKEVQALIKQMEALTRKINSSEKSARDYLIKTGIYTKGGALTKHYR
jgi:hypothetical protein